MCSRHRRRIIAVPKVDIGKPGTRKNAGIANRYGLATRKGIPAAVVVLADGKKLLTVDGPQMADLRAKGVPAVVKFFDPNAPSAAR